jgi:hypothetical protein
MLEVPTSFLALLLGTVVVVIMNPVRPCITPFITGFRSNPFRFFRSKGRSFGASIFIKFH